MNGINSLTNKVALITGGSRGIGAVSQSVDTSQSQHAN